jgi:hypothetical protein
MMQMKGESTKKSEIMDQGEYVLDLDEVPNGDWKPVETCEYI